MNRKIQLQKWLLVGVAIPLFTACSSYFDVQNIEIAPWETTIAVPLLSGSLSMEDMTADVDTAFLNTKDDGLLEFVYNDTLISYRIGDIVNIGDFSLSESGTFELPSLDDLSFSDEINIGEIVGGDIPSGSGTIPPASFGDHNFTLPALAAFESVRFSSGEIVISIDNNFSAPLSFRLLMTDSENTLVAQANFNIPAKGSQSRTIALGSKKITNSLKVSMRNISTTGANAAYRANERIAFNFDLNDIDIEEITFVPTEDLVYTQNLPIELPMPFGIEAYNISFIDGKITYEIASTLGIDLSVKVEFPSASQNGNPLTGTINANNGNGSGNISIANSNIDLTQGSLGYNTLPTIFTATIPASGNSITLFKNNTVTVTAGISDMEFGDLSAYLGNETIDLGGDELDISVFKNTLSAVELDLQLVNPVLDFIVTNEYGVPFDFAFTNTKVSKNDEASQLDILFSENPVRFPAGTASNPSRTTFGVENLNDIFNFQPQKIAYQAAVKLNPTGKRTNNINSEQRITILTDVVIPMHGRMMLQARGNPIDADLSAGGTVENITKLTFHLELSNGFPVSVAPQFYFLNAQGNVIDSLFHNGDNRLFASAQINNQGLVTQATTTAIDIELDASRLSTISETRQIIFSSTMQTANNAQQDVKILNSYRIGAQLGATVSATINP